MKTLLSLLLCAALGAGSVPENAPPAAPPDRQVLDRIVAVVERQPLLLSELELEARVAFIRQGGAAASESPLSEEDLARTLEYVIGQRLVWDEAERLQVFEVADEETGQALASFEGRFPSKVAFRHFLSSLEASEDQLAAVLRRELRVTRFLDSKVKLLARVGEEQLRDFYRDHPEQFAGQSYAAVREAIKAHLTRERYRELTRTQLDELRTRADVRLLAPFARRPSAANQEKP